MRNKLHREEKFQQKILEKKWFATKTATVNENLFSYHDEAGRRKKPSRGWKWKQTTAGFRAAATKSYFPHVKTNIQSNCLPSGIFIKAEKLFSDGDERVWTFSPKTELLLGIIQSEHILNLIRFIDFLIFDFKYLKRRGNETEVKGGGEKYQLPRMIKIPLNDTRNDKLLQWGWETLWLQMFTQHYCRSGSTQSHYFMISLPACCFCSGFSPETELLWWFIIRVINSIHFPWAVSTHKYKLIKAKAASP